MCISVPYGNTEGPVGYTSVRRLQHVHVWMCVDMSRAYVRSTPLVLMCCKCAHRSYHVMHVCDACQCVRACGATGNGSALVRVSACDRLLALHNKANEGAMRMRAYAKEDGGTPHPRRACGYYYASMRAT